MSCLKLPYNSICDKVYSLSSTQKGMKHLHFLIFTLVLISCNQNQSKKETPKAPIWKQYDQARQIAENSENKSARLRYKLIQSKVSGYSDVSMIINSRSWPSILSFSQNLLPKRRPIRPRPVKNENRLRPSLLI